MCVHVHSGKEKRMNRAEKKGVGVGEGKEMTGLGNKWMRKGKNMARRGSECYSHSRLHESYGPGIHKIHNKKPSCC